MTLDVVQIKAALWFRKCVIRGREKKLMGASSRTA